MEPQATFTIYLPIVSRSCPRSDVWTDTKLGDTTVYALAISPGVTQTLCAGTASEGLYRRVDDESWELMGLESWIVTGIGAGLDEAGALYAVTWGGGVQHWDSSTKAWAAANDGLEPHLWLYAISGGQVEGKLVLYAGTHDAGVFRWTEDAEAWEAGSSDPEDLEIRSLAVDPSDASIVYAGTANLGVFWSNDAGENWQALNVNIEDRKIWAVAVDPAGSPVYAGTTGGEVFELEDPTVANPEWYLLGTSMSGSAVRALAIDPRPGHVLYAGTDGEGVFYYDAETEKWETLGSGLGNTRVKALVIGPGPCPVLYAGTEEGVWSFAP